MNETHLLSVCSALGGFERDHETKQEVFVPGDEALDCVRDIKNYLKFEENSKTRTVFLFLGSWKVVENTMIPLALCPQTTPKVRAAVLELLVPITWEVDYTSNDVPTQLEYLVSIKRAFAESQIMKCILTEIVALLSTDYKSRTEREHAQIGLLLTLVKNVLAIKVTSAASTASSQSHYFSTLQEGLVLAMHKCKFLDFLVAFTGSLDKNEYSEWNILIQDIIYFIYEHRSAERIINTTIIDKDAALSILSIGNSRHAKFGSNFAYNTQGKQVLSKKTALTAAQDMNKALDIGKKERKVKVTTIDLDIIKEIQDPECLDAYRKFTEKILSNCFNSYVTSIKRDIDMDRTFIKEKDILRFTWFCRFFLDARCQFQNYHPEKRELYSFDTVTALMNVRGFSFINRRIQMYIEEKQHISQLKSCLECLCMMLQTLQHMCLSENEDYQDLAHNIQSNLFYEEDYIKTIPMLCKIKTDSLPFLKVVVETTHSFICLLSSYAKMKSGLTVRSKKVVGEEEEVRMVEKEYTLDRVYSQFLSENVVDMYMKVIRRFRETNDTILNHAIHMLHRICVKYEMIGFMYKMSYLEVFYEILEEPRDTKSFKEVTRFVKYVIGKFFSVVKEYPLLFLEIFYHKTKSDCIRIQNGDLKQVMAVSKIKNDNTDLEFKEPDLPLGDKIGVTIKAVLETESLGREGVEYLISCLSECKSQREESDGEHNEYGITPKSELLVTYFHNNKFKLLLSLFTTPTIADASTIMYTISTSTTPFQLGRYVEVMQTYLDDPFNTNGRSLSTYFRKKKKEKERKKAAVGLTSNLSKEIISESDLSDIDDVDGESKQIAVEETKEKLEDNSESSLSESNESELETDVHEDAKRLESEGASPAEENRLIEDTELQPQGDLLAGEDKENISQHEELSKTPIKRRQLEEEKDNTEEVIKPLATKKIRIFDSDDE